VLAQRESNYGLPSKEPDGCKSAVFPGTYVLSKVDEQWRKDYERV
jgi:hypothetical protein